MSHPSGPVYDPLPLTHDQTHTDQLYNAPSPAPDSAQQSVHVFEPSGDSAFPSGAAPRFMGAARYDDRARDSYASSYGGTDGGRGSEYDSSIYALNESNHNPASLSSPYHDDPHDFAGDRGMSMSPLGKPAGGRLEEKRAMYAAPKSKRRVFLIAGGIGLAILAIVIALGVYFGVVKPHNGASTAGDAASGDSSSGSGSSSSGGKDSSGSKSNLAVTGGDGSKVTMEDGSTYTYSNQFGGTWYWDVNDPFNNGARAQSWTPALNETFNYGVDKIRGVNLGGWLTVEPVSSNAPALFEPYVNNTTPAIDEWTLSQAMAADKSNGGLSQLEKHYQTFITEQDFAEIAAAGLNYVRIALPFWAIETRGNEPFLAKTAWTYFLKAIEWARKYGIRINLDFHALPGSQNGWNHSGKLGDINMLMGPMGLANAQRSLDYIRVIAEFISQPQYSSVVTMFGITNEPRAQLIGTDQIQSFYLQAYEVVRKASGTGEGKGPMISFHDAFVPRTDWAGFLPNADRISLDSHPYLCFQTQSTAPIGTYAKTPCSSWGADVNSSMANFGLTQAGEFSNAVTDCGLWVNGVNQGIRYEGSYVADSSFKKVGDCTVWTDWQNYDQGTKDDIKQFALASMDALQNWFFWTWKIGNSSVTGKVESPAWSYKLGLEQGWMPKDPRAAAGTCGNSSPWQPPLKAWQTGGPGSGIAASVSAQYPWPPATISFGGVPSELPKYTPTGAIPTLSAATFSQSGVKATATPSAGNGWANADDNASMMTDISTCSYLDPWVGTTAAPPSPLCSGGTRRRREPALELREPMVTAMPAL